MIILILIGASEATLRFHPAHPDFDRLRDRKDVRAYDGLDYVAIYHFAHWDKFKAVFTLSAAERSKFRFVVPPDTVAYDTVFKKWEYEQPSGPCEALKKISPITNKDEKNEHH